MQHIKNGMGFSLKRLFFFLFPRGKWLSMLDAALFDSALFMIRVCFLYLERGWLRGDILILGQTGLVAWMDQKEKQDMSRPQL